MPVPAPLPTGHSKTVRVLFVAHDSQLYGAQLSLLDILRNLDRTRFSPVVTAPQKGPFTDEVERLGIPVTAGKVGRWMFQRIPFTLRTFMRRPWLLVRTPILCLIFLLTLPVRLGSLLRLIRHHGVDVVYTNTITVIDGALAAWLSSKPHIWHLREQTRGNRGVLNLIPNLWVPRLVLRLSTLIAVNSFALKEQVFSGVETHGKVVVIHNGIDPEQFKTAPTFLRLRTSLGLPQDAPLIAICGFIQACKGHETFIRSAARIREKYPEAHFVVIGDGFGTYLNRLKSLAHQLGLGQHLHFTGWRNDIPEIFPEIDVLVIASEQESFGRTVIEGMAAGRPIVSTRCGGPEEIVVHGETGFLVAIGDYGEMADRITELLDNPLLAYNFGQAGRKRVEDSFTHRATLRSVEQLIVNALSFARRTG